MFSDNIRLLLKSQNKTQAQLAKYVGVKQNTVSDWLNLGTSPKIDHIYRIAEFFSTSFDFLFFGKEIPSSKVSDSTETEIIERYRFLDNDGKDIVRATIINEIRRMEQQKPLEVSITQESGELNLNPREAVVSAPKDKDTTMNGSKSQSNHCSNRKRNA